MQKARFTVTTYFMQTVTTAHFKQRLTRRHTERAIMHKSTVLIGLCIIISLIVSLNAQYSAVNTIFEETLTTTAASQIDFQIINKLPGSVAWTNGNSTDVVSIIATISGPTEDVAKYIVIDVDYIPTEQIRIVVDLNITSYTPSTDIITYTPRPRRQSLVSSAPIISIDHLLQVFAAFAISLFRKRSTTLLAVTVVVLCAGLSTAEVEQTAQLTVDIVVIVPRDHFWQSVSIETKNSNVSLINVNTLNKTCGLLDSTSSCPFCCSSNGVCTMNGCACTSGYSGNDCSVGECVPTNCFNNSCPEVDSPCGCSALGVCSMGTVKCQNNELKCVGAIFPASSIDSCGVDSNCDGAITSQPDFSNDTEHCGGCNKRCADLNANALWSCSNAECVFQGCKQGYYDLTGNHSCAYQCQFTSPNELCNGLDDNCDGQIDENVVVGDIKKICGIGAAANRSECTTQVSAQCVSGVWQCSFPPNVCSPSCAAAAEICDNLDNNCNGVLNENVPQLGLPCASDDGSAISHGACRTTGTYVCNGPNNVTCSAVKASCSSLPGGCTELCDGIDNDCDGVVDEVFTQKGSVSATFVMPTVTLLSTSLWMTSYEISRASSTKSSLGFGNGWTTANSDTIDATRGCSANLRMPWTQVSPLEAVDVCGAMGGRLCTLTEWRFAIASNATCNYGYSPATAATCQQSNTATRYCNIQGNAGGTSATQFTFFPTATLSSVSCGADWSILPANTGNATRVWDITGNLFEIVADGSGYAMVGGSFRTVERGVRRTVSQTITSTQRFSDLGFRCCFDSNPTL